MHEKYQRSEFNKKEKYSRSHSIKKKGKLDETNGKCILF